MPSGALTAPCFCAMTERYIQASRAILLDPASEPSEVAALGSGWPQRKVRRMSTLGILLATLVEEAPPATNAAVFYATTYTEARSLERYLESLPDASPTRFQTSIHPGGIEQALILAGLPVEALYPLAGEEYLVSQSFQLALNNERDKAVIYGGEESGTWLADLGIASRCSFAFALHIDDNPTDALGSLRWVEAGAGDDGPDHARPAGPTLFDVAAALSARKPLAWTSPFGRFDLEWHLP